MHGPRLSTWRLLLFPESPPITKKRRGSTYPFNPAARQYATASVHLWVNIYTKRLGHSTTSRALPQLWWLACANRHGKPPSHLDPDQRPNAPRVIDCDKDRDFLFWSIPMRLFFLIFTLASTALAGVGVTAVLAAGMDGWEPIVIAAAIGTAISAPAAWVASKKIASL
jgi:hypothetical protein